MRKVQYVFVMLAFVFTGTTMASCQTTNPNVKQLTVKEFSENIKSVKDAVILDVRTPEEFADGHIPGAVNIDFYGADFSAKIKNLDPQKQYYVYCASGNRSGQATGKMANLGFKNLYNMSNGGYSNWLKANR